MDKKTTLMIDQNLYGIIRQRAATQGKSVSAIVSDALREYLAKSDDKPRKRISLTTAEGGGWIGPADPFSNAELFDAMDAGTPADRLR